MAEDDFHRWEREFDPREAEEGGSGAGHWC